MSSFNDWFKKNKGLKSFLTHNISYVDVSTVDSFLVPLNS